MSDTLTDQIRKAVRQSEADALRNVPSNRHRQRIDVASFANGLGGLSLAKIWTGWRRHLLGLRITTKRKAK